MTIEKGPGLSTIQSIRGMNDILPTETDRWQHLEQLVSQLLSTYGYREVRFPIVEFTELFNRSIGEVTDIVEKEMYTFFDRNNESLTLRPEGTASCVRLCLQHGLLDNQQHQRLWYKGPMFRYEKPQKGRMRQFHQIGVEAFGMATPDIDAEHICLTARLWQKLGVDHVVKLELNSLGNAESRTRYRNALVEYLSDFQSELDEDSRRRLKTNPLRILDSKADKTREILENAPTLDSYLDQESKAHFAELLEILDRTGIRYQLNPRLVRGLDYYSKTVFEWVTDQLGAQGTVCAGGRYDSLVDQLGGKPVPAVGFAMGIERLLLLIESAGKIPVASAYAPDIYVAISGEGAPAFANQVVEKVHESCPSLKLIKHCGGGSLKSQFKRADKSGARLAFVIGQDEVARHEVVCKPLRDGEPQVSVGIEELVTFLDKYI